MSRGQQVERTRAQMFEELTRRVGRSKKRHKELAQLAGMKPSHFSNLIRGKKPFTLDAYVRLLWALDAKLDVSTSWRGV